MDNFAFVLVALLHTELMIQRAQLIVIHPVNKFPDLIKHEY